MPNPADPLKNFEEGAKLVEVGLKNVLKTLEAKMAEDLPLDKKDVTVDGKNIFVSLTKDNKVIFNFASSDHAQPFYSRANFNSFVENLEKYEKQILELSEMIRLEKKKTWWQKLWNK